MTNTFSNQQEILQMLNRSAEVKRTQEDEKREQEKTRQPSKSIGPVIGLDGIKISEDGVMTKTRYFNTLEIDPEKYGDITFTEEEAIKISRSIRHLSTGVNAAVPLTCAGSQCPFEATCAYVEVGKAPIGRPCLVEGQLIVYWTQQFIEEFNVDINNFTEVQLVSELAEFNIYELRVTKYLAEKHQTLMQDVVTSVDVTGEVIENQEVSRAFDLKERIKRNRMKVLEALMATRKERVKISAERNTGTSTAAKLTELREKLDEYLGDIKKQKPIDATIISDEKNQEDLQE